MGKVRRFNIDLERSAYQRVLLKDIEVEVEGDDDSKIRRIALGLIAKRYLGDKAVNARWSRSTVAWFVADEESPWEISDIVEVTDAHP